MTSLEIVIGVVGGVCFALGFMAGLFWGLML